MLIAPPTIMVRMRPAPGRRRPPARACQCPESSNRWAITEGIARIKGGITGFKEDARDFKNVLLPGAETKAYNAKGATFAADQHVRQDRIKKDRFWLDDDKHVDVYLDDAASIANATETINVYRTKTLTGAHADADDPKPRSKYDDDFEQLQREAKILSTKAMMATNRKRLREDSGKGRYASASGGGGGGGSRAKADILGSPPFFGGAVKGGKSNKVYNYDKVSKTAGALIGNFSYRTTPGEVGLRRTPDCTCRRQ